MAISRQRPKKGGNVNVFRKVWGGQNRRGAESTRRISTEDRRKASLREVEERDLSPRLGGKPSIIDKMWLDEVTKEVQNLIEKAMKQDKVYYVTAANKLLRKSPFGLLGKTFIRVDGKGNETRIFIGKNPFTGKFYYASNRRILKKGERTGKNDRRTTKEEVFEETD